MLDELKKSYSKPEISFTGKLKNSHKIIYKYIVVWGVGFLMIYLLMLTPVFFLYPNYNKSVKLNFEKKWFTDISNSLSGDCFRKVQDFRRKCPFQTREIHLNSIHTIVEIKINCKWLAYDPCYDLFFDNYNVTQISFDINRNFIIDSLKNYPYKYSFYHFHFYNNLYFAMLNYTHPYYDNILRMYYGISN